MKKAIRVLLLIFFSTPFITKTNALLLVKNNYTKPIIALAAFNNNAAPAKIIIQPGEIKNIGFLFAINNLAVKTTLIGSLAKNIMSYVQQIQEKARYSDNNQNGVGTITIHNSLTWKFTPTWQNAPTRSIPMIPGSQEEQQLREICAAQYTRPMTRTLCQTVQEALPTKETHAEKIALINSFYQQFLQYKKLRIIK